MRITELLKGKSVCIWGYGREGKSTENFIKKCCEDVSIAIHEGDRSGINEEQFDLIIKSPGIVMEEEHPKYTSQTQLFLMEFSKQTIGITGTKGKSTTTALMAHTLGKTAGRPVLFLGNIGLPCLDYYEEIGPETIIVFEMSCHQLAHTTVSPHIAIFLNLYEDHLDYYKTMDKYFTAKSHIAAYQSEEDYYLCGENVPDFETRGKKTVFEYGKKYDYSLKLLGEHNQYNAHIVDYVCSSIFGRDSKEVRLAMSDFTALPHRLQNLGCFNGIDYYDDSISTIPEAAIQACESVANIGTILIGGMDRGIEYDILEAFIPKHSQIQFICMYESGKRVYDETLAKAADGPLDRLPNMQYVANLEEAVALAAELTPSGKACVLSPAAASYGYFKNFEHRGDVFQELVKNAGYTCRDN